MPANRAKRLAFSLIAVAGVAVAAEMAAWVAFKTRLQRYEIIRGVLLGGQTSMARYQRSIGQPYLLYAPAPANFSHNEGGYRGRELPMRRRPGHSRVLCLGGSTTYSWLVRDPEKTYPAQLERILEARAPAGVEGVEVINGGLPAGSSAELLTHYHFKWHFFRPDVVVINTGGNDAEAVVRDYYQPDYSHWRRPLANPEALPPQSRWLVRSRFLSAFVIYLFRSEFLTTQHVQRADLPPPTLWYPDFDRRGRDEAIPDGELAFRHNLESLIALIRRDGGKVLLVGFRERPENTYDPARRAAIARSRQVLESLAQEHGLPYLPFPAAVISPGNWADSRCHLNAAGEGEKAAYLAPAVAQLLWPGTGPGEGAPD